MNERSERKISKMAKKEGIFNEKGKITRAQIGNREVMRR